MVGLGVYLIVLIFQSLGTSVQLFAGGFSAKKRGKTTIAAWGDVATITQQIIRHRYRGITIWTSHVYKLELTNGEKLRFTEALGKITELGEKMQQQITHTLTPRALEALRSGASLPFGKLSVNPLGISNGTETLAWGEISDVKLQNGVIVIGKVGKRLRWTSAAVGEDAKRLCLPLPGGHHAARRAGPTAGASLSPGSPHKPAPRLLNCGGGAFHLSSEVRPTKSRGRRRGEAGGVR